MNTGVRPQDIQWMLGGLQRPGREQRTTFEFPQDIKQKKYLMTNH